jgi:(1->4)-alpha-D-glucan 1-alpha-D-glucosylmutase
LPSDWPVDGTTGYDFLNALNYIFVDGPGSEALEREYARITDSDLDFRGMQRRRQRFMMGRHFAAEVEALSEELGRLAATDRHGRDIPRGELARALMDVTACLPVYRTYVKSPEVPSEARASVEAAIEDAFRFASETGATPAAIRFIGRVLLLQDPPRGEGEAWLRFLMAWQQFSGPVMAKGVEDTALYAFNPLISLNEVGGDPGNRGLRGDVEAFHRTNTRRRATHPRTMNATSTHDTKRSEDVRARINVLSEIPDIWIRELRRWMRWNRGKRTTVDGHTVPDPSEEVLLYQTLVGAWPLDPGEVPGFEERLKAYLVKAAREAKFHTSWMAPNEAHEEALSRFVDAILTPSGGEPFLQDFLRFQARVAYYGALNSLSQVLLKAVSPGIPDFYQGSELWDLSLVDPDNRRPVDFEHRRQLLAELKGREPGDAAGLLRELLRGWADGRVKLYVTHRVLQLRRSATELFLDGEYIPLQASGPRAGNVCALARRSGEDWVVAAAPRWYTRLVARRGLPLGRSAWRETSLALPAEAPEGWRDVFTGETHRARGDPQGRRGLRLASLCRRFPLALLRSQG